MRTSGRWHPTTWVRGHGALVAVVLLALAAALAGMRAAPTGDGDEAASYPADWAPEVLPFVDVVEDERDLDFLHPVHVEFLDEEEFRRQVTSDRADLTEEDEEQIEQFTGLFRALGLIEGDVDLFDATNDLSGAGTLGYYSYDDERIRVRGASLTPASEVTLVHELTHALQDQHFDLGARYDAYEEAEDTAGSTAFQALVEGDASRVETAYTEGLSDAERDELDAEQDSGRKAYQQDVADIPEVLRTLSGAPYTLGEAMLTLAVARDGNDAVDALFEEPPATEEHLLDPWTLVADEDVADDPPAPELADGEEELDAGPFGALGWYLVLAERVPLLDALDAVDGWGGDAYVAFERDGTSCVRINHRSDTAADRTQLLDALRAWVDTLPGAPASVRRTGSVLEFESCDPGPAADVGTESSQAALRLAVTRTYLSIGAVQAGADEEVARCVADGLVHAFTLAQVQDPRFGAEDPQVQARIRRIVLGCR